MIRKIVIPNKTTVRISLTVPADYIGQEMEVIVFTRQEGLVQNLIPDKKVSFQALSIDTRGLSFSRNDANER